MCVRITVHKHNTTQKSSDNFPLIPQTSITAEMMSNGGMRGGYS